MYILQEIQTSNGVTALVAPIQYANREDAASAYYTTCGYAVKSAVEEHTVMVFTHDGFVIPELCKCFRHPAPTGEVGD